MTTPEWLLLILRLLGYTGLALLCLIVVPTYHRSFRLSWRAVGLYYLVVLGTVIIRLKYGSMASLAYNDYVITPALLLVLLAIFRNLWTVSLWRQGQGRGN